MDSVIIQPTLALPTKIAAGIANGKLFLEGGVVRDALTGRIVTLLKDAPGAQSSPEVLRRSAALLRSRGAIVATVLTLAAGAVALAVLKKREQARKPDALDCVANLNASLRTYLEADQEGRLDASIIGRLISDLDAMKAYSDANSISVEFSNEMWESLVKLVIDHTQKLADAYSIDLEKIQESTASFGNDNVIDLRLHLEVQQRIITSAEDVVDDGEAEAA
ncbi:hypothetical protein [Micromonospora sp. WMMD736]|uniref:hypothetical protein n=1 Tax=Micromonospora sp. WMMD736 TaxID=3404112 RepID=UPI003B950235